ncbi:hypothetical protein [Streptomyces sp. L7]|uniref:hypothetical protein n=1 Tax=Streptomyces sp. L7 TaxID=3423954 RepID=UPI003D964AED
MAQHHGEDERAGTRRILDRDAVQFAEGLRVQRGGLQEGGGLQPGERQGHASADRWDDRRGADGRAAGGDRREIAPLEDAGELGGRGLRVPSPQTAQVREDDRALDAEEAVEGVVDGARGVAAAGRTAGRGDEGLGSLAHLYRV